MHGDKTIRRRKDVPPQKDYRKYEVDLQIDFCHLCGYCGKHEMFSFKGMESDHFVPDRIDHSRKCDYTNLVYSCFTCNRKKSGKWPTEDKGKPNDGQMGFVDPATEDFDRHLGRNNDGALEYYTDVGKYMFEIAFRFDIRPTKAIWKASMLYESLNTLKGTLNGVMPGENECLKFFQAIEALEDLRRYLFECKE